MKPSLHIALTVEHALAQGLPVDAELSRIAAGDKTSGDRVATAAALARDGQLAAAMKLLRIDRLVAASALLAPASAREVGDRMRTLPAGGAVVLPIALPVAYLGALLAGQGFIAILLVLKVLPVLEEMSPGRGASLLGKEFAAAGILLAIAVALLAAEIVFGGRLARAIFGTIHAARLLSAAEALAAHGVAPGTSLPRLCESTGFPMDTLVRLAGPASIDGPTCGELSTYFAATSAARVERIAAFTKVGGAILAASLAFLLAGSIYLAIMNIPGQEILRR